MVNIGEFIVNFYHVINRYINTYFSIATHPSLDPHRGALLNAIDIHQIELF
jgi:hypothetical protein